MNNRDLQYEDIPKICDLEVDLSKNILVQFSLNPMNTIVSNSEGIVDINCVNYLKKVSENEKFNFDICKEIYTKENNDWKNFNRLIYSLGKMNRLSEQIFDEIKKVVERYCYYISLDELSLKNSDCKKNRAYTKQDFHKLTFANFKSILSCILKTDNSFYEIEGLKEKEDRKNFSRIFNEYITRRDFYTHGILYLFLPKKEPILKIQKDGKEKYIKYQKVDFEVNLKIFLFLYTILRDIGMVIQDKKPSTLTNS
ncbi:hypothetical protein [Capnocytophaga leadbetteri]